MMIRAGVIRALCLPQPYKLLYLPPLGVCALHTLIDFTQERSIRDTHFNNHEAYYREFFFIIN